MSSLNIAATGIIIVFIALALIASAITIFGRIIGVRSKKSANRSGKPFESAGQTPSSGEIKDGNARAIEGIPDREIVAVITAALQSAMSDGTDITRLKVRSFKMISNEIPVWKTASWYEQIGSVRSGHR